MRRGFPKPSCPGIGRFRRSTADIWLSWETALWKHATWLENSKRWNEGDSSHLDKLVPKLEYSMDNGFRIVNPTRRKVDEQVHESLPFYEHNWCSLSCCKSQPIKRSGLDNASLFSRMVFTQFGHSTTPAKLALHTFNVIGLSDWLHMRGFSCSWQGFLHQQPESHLLVGSTEQAIDSSLQLKPKSVLFLSISGSDCGIKIGTSNFWAPQLRKINNGSLHISINKSEAHFRNALSIYLIIDSTVRFYH
jgi:hypothetical protein